jgi:2'-5' RNA ligase
VVRAFAALPLPDGHREELARYLAACAEAAPDFRWVLAEGLHLTLRFAGNLEDEVAGRLAAALREVRHPSFDLRVAGIGNFGGSRRASVIWMGLVDGRAEAAGLAAQCERACQKAGLEPDARSFRPHVTLARARDRRGGVLPGLPDPPELPAWRAQEFVLFRSELRGGRPPLYTPIERYPLTV